MQKPGFWRLFGAYGIDIFLLWFLNFGYYMSKIHFISLHAQSVAGDMLINLLVFVILNGGYFAMLEWKGRGSFGKKILRLKLRIPRPSFLRVFTAYGTECILFFVLIYAIIFFADFATRKQSMDVGIFITLATGWLLCPILICFYYSILEHKYSCALGKKLLGLAVVQDVPAKENK